MGRPSARGAVRCRRKPVQLGVSPGDGWILRHYLQVGVRGSHGVRRAVHRALPWRRGQCFCPGAGYRVGRNRALHARYDGARHSGGKRRIGAAPGRRARRQADGEGVFLLARGVWHLFHFKRRRNVSTGRVEPPVHRLRAGNGAPVRQRRARSRLCRSRAREARARSRLSWERASREGCVNCGCSTARSEGWKCRICC